MGAEEVEENEGGRGGNGGRQQAGIGTPHRGHGM